MHAGFLRGYPNEYARLRKRNLTRGELAALAARFLKRIQPQPPAESVWFKDIRGDEWWLGAAVVATGAGVMDGYPDRTFRGEQPATRSEMACVLARVDRAIQGKQRS